LNVPVSITSSVAGEVSKKVQIAGLALAEYVAFFNNPFGADQQMLCTPGIILMGALVLAVIIWIKGKASAPVKVLTVSSVVMLILASDVFPWDGLAYRFKVFNILAQVQFPWRYVILAILFLTVLLGCILSEGVLEKVLPIDSKHIVKWSIVISTAMMLLFTSHYQDYANRTKYYDTYNLDTYGYIGGEYLRTHVMEEEIIWTDVNLFNGRFDVGNAESLNVVDRSGTDFDLVCRTGSEECTIIAPLLNYKGYMVFDDNGNTYTISDSDNHLVSFVLPAGFDGNLYIRFISPWYWSAALILSVVGMVLIVLYGLFGKKSFRRDKASAIMSRRSE
jgi:hypothetical protein